MTRDHEDVVASLYEDALKQIQHQDWDRVERNIEYHHPNPYHEHHENPLGEMDLAFYDLDEGRVKYVEVKTCEDHVEDAFDQLERARDFYESFGLEFEGEVYFEDTKELRGETHTYSGRRRL